MDGADGGGRWGTAGGLTAGSGRRPILSVTRRRRGERGIDRAPHLLHGQECRGDVARPHVRHGDHERVLGLRQSRWVAVTAASAASTFGVRTPPDASSSR